MTLCINVSEAVHFVQNRRFTYGSSASEVYNTCTSLVLVCTENELTAFQKA